MTRFSEMFRNLKEQGVIPAQQSSRPPQAPPQRPVSQENQLQKEFNDTLRDRFHLVPHNWQFPIHLAGAPNVKSITVLPLETNETIYLIVKYVLPSGVSAHFTATLDNNGTLFCRVPKELRSQLQPQQILRELINDCKRIDLDRCVDLNYSIFKPEEAQDYVEHGRHPENSDDVEFSRDGLVDPVRLEHLYSLGAHTIFRGAPDGPIKQYYIAIFSGRDNRGFAVMESPHLFNAAFIIPLTMPMNSGELQNMTREEREILRDLLRPQLSITRSHAKKIGTRVVHIGENWRERITQEVKNLL